jgi:MoxR-like ATPase
VHVREIYDKVHAELARGIIGQEDLLEFALAALFSSGHVLLEGMPGTAKTMLARTMAAALNMDFKRIQMTPDLLPGDITGSSIYNDATRTFDFVKGPVFTNFLLADELNRASARTQSALLESMQELTVSYGSTVHPLPHPFIVFATQNPVEQEGTYPLPLAQLDRFMFKLHSGYPDTESEVRVLKEHHATGGRSDPTKIGVKAVVSAEEINEASTIIRETLVRDEVAQYVCRLMQATREDASLAVGASPRAGLMLLMGAKSLARFEDRDFVTPDDIKAAFLPAMRHRVMLSPGAELEGAEADDILRAIANTVEVPR